MVYLYVARRYCLFLLTLESTMTLAQIYRFVGHLIYRVTRKRLPYVPFFKANPEMDKLAEEIMFRRANLTAAYLYGGFETPVTAGILEQKLADIIASEEGQMLRVYLAPYIALRGVDMWSNNPWGVEYFRWYAEAQFKDN